jgi:hypothetical protein
MSLMSDGAGWLFSWRPWGVHSGVTIRAPVKQKGGNRKSLDKNGKSTRSQSSTMTKSRSIPAVLTVYALSVSGLLLPKAVHSNAGFQHVEGRVSFGMRKHAAQRPSNTAPGAAHAASSSSDAAAVRDKRSFLETSLRARQLLLQGVLGVGCRI